MAARGNAGGALGGEVRDVGTHAHALMTWRVAPWAWRPCRGVKPQPSPPLQAACLCASRATSTATSAPLQGDADALRASTSEEEEGHEQPQQGDEVSVAGAYSF